MPDWTDPRLALIALAVAMVLLAIGLRGRLVDRDPRCRARRCRYPLRDLLEAKRSANEPAWPITCPECGRVMESESRTRRGARRRVPSVIGVGLALAIPAVGVLGFEVHARWRSAHSLSTMPLWLLLHQMERDSVANNFLHQRELLQRVRDGSIAGEDARRAAERVLRLLEDPRVDHVLAADALPLLAQQGAATPEQIDRLWRALWIFELVLPERVEEGEPIPIEVRGRYRGPTRYTPGGEPTPIPGAPFTHLISAGTGVVVTRLSLNGVESQRVPLDLMGGSADGSPDIEHWGLRADSDAWRSMPRATGAGSLARVEVDIVAALTRTEQFGGIRDPRAGRGITARQWLEARGAPESWRATLTGSTRVVPRGGAPVATSRSPAWESWYRARLADMSIGVVRQPHGGLSVSVSRERIGDGAIPVEAVTLYADQSLRWGRWSTELFPIADDMRYNGVTGGSLRARELETVVALWAMANPDGWELVITPRPERARTSARRVTAWAGDPIVAPLRLDVTWYCHNPPPQPRFLSDSPGATDATD